MAEPTKNPALERALRIGLAGIVLIATSIAWVFFRSDTAMFGVAEVLALIGMVMALGAVWKAAEATAGDD